MGFMDDSTSPSYLLIVSNKFG